ncbi:glia maturation factor beta-like [Ruditapes philippinarum]|uniref:glia maturation factor beta-like n=1 Tax=Ruditapes philippinarum TaxID=129788 RepID=UPI00295ADD76|nr:glia maturation factor beta-like [Ruditapes philippinarum]
MAQNVKVCDISEEVKEKLKKFRFRKDKNVAALLMKVDTASQTIVMDGEEHTDISIEELQEELPEHQPRFLVISYVRDHGDGRISYPLIFIYICPSGIKTELCMMYAGSRNLLQKELGLTKVFEIRDLEDFTEEWLNDKLSFFK